MVIRKQYFNVKKTVRGAIRLRTVGWPFSAATATKKLFLVLKFDHNMV